MNDEFVLVHAGFFAERVEHEAGHDPAVQVRAAYRIALSRDPSDTELRGNLKYLEQQREYHASRKRRSPGELALTDLCAVILNLNEFVYIN
jgi:hypothetical protein